MLRLYFFFFQAEDGIRDRDVTGVQTCALPIWFRQIVKAEIPCNWFQCQENSIDPVHFEWTHSNWSVRLAGAAGPYTPRHVKIDFSEFEYGFQYKRIRTDTSDKDRLWTVGRVCLW